MNESRKIVVSFGLAFFTSVVVITTLSLTKVLGMEALWANLITIPFTTIFVWLFVKQVDVSLNVAVSGKGAQAFSSLFFIVRIFILLIPCVTFGVLRSKEIWIDGLWGSIGAIGSLTIGLGLLVALTSKERMAGKIMINNTLDKVIKEQEDEEELSKHAKKILNKLDQIKKEES